MKKAAKLIVVLILLALGSQTAFVSATALDPPDLPYKPPEQSREELYQDIFLSLLMPTIQDEVNKYYSKYLTEPPMIAPYMVYVLSAERPDGYRSFRFRIKLRVDSYIGPHNPVGLDYITFAVNGPGDVKVEEFEHIKSYELPPNDAHIIRRGYGNPIP